MAMVYLPVLKCELIKKWSFFWYACFQPLKMSVGKIACEHVCSGVVTYYTSTTVSGNQFLLIQHGILVVSLNVSVCLLLLVGKFWKLMAVFNLIDMSYGILRDFLRECASFVSWLMHSAGTFWPENFWH